MWISPGAFVRGSGAAGGTRTPDPIITNDVLYHLSYCGFHGDGNHPYLTLIPPYVPAVSDVCTRPSSGSG